MKAEDPKCSDPGPAQPKSQVTSPFTSQFLTGATFQRHFCKQSWGLFQSKALFVTVFIYFLTI